MHVSGHVTCSVGPPPACPVWRIMPSLLTIPFHLIALLCLLSSIHLELAVYSCSLLLSFLQVMSLLRVWAASQHREWLCCSNGSKPICLVCCFSPNILPLIYLFRFTFSFPNAQVPCVTQLKSPSAPWYTRTAISPCQWTVTLSASNLLFLSISLAFQDCSFTTELPASQTKVSKCAPFAFEPVNHLYYSISLWSLTVQRPPLIKSPLISTLPESNTSVGNNRPKQMLSTSMSRWVEKWQT